MITDTDKQFMIRTSTPDIYDFLVGTEKKFRNQHHLFTFGLIYGILHNMHSEKKFNKDIVYLSAITDNITKSILEVAYCILDDGKPEREIFNEILRIADGGIVELQKIYDQNKDFGIPNLIQEAESLWKTRVLNLHNINLSTTKDSQS